MKILYFGAGVLGTTYSWLLSEAGHEVDIFVKKEKYELNNKGINIKCYDQRGRKSQLLEIKYKPNLKYTFSENDKYNLIIVSVRSNQIVSALESLKKCAGNTDILFLQNFWLDCDQVDNYLNPNQYLFGFPGISGGKNIEGIFCNVAKNGKMNLGEKDGKETPRLRKIQEMFKSAGFNPVISSNILTGIYAHFTWEVGTFALVKKAESFEKLASDSKLIKESWLAIREGFEVCKARGFDPRIDPNFKQFYLPLFILVPFTKLTYKTELWQTMFGGHLKHSKDEIKEMYFEVIRKGKDLDLNMSKLKSYEKYFSN